MAEKKEKEQRFIYVKDPALTVTGIANLEEAIVVKNQLLGLHPEPEFRVRNRLRSRTGLWDVLVKRRTTVKEPTRITQVERELGEHAYPGSDR